MLDIKEIRNQINSIRTNKKTNLADVSLYYFILKVNFPNYPKELIEWVLKDIKNSEILESKKLGIIDGLSGLIFIYMILLNLDSHRDKIFGNLIEVLTKIKFVIDNFDESNSSLGYGYSGCLVAICSLKNFNVNQNEKTLEIPECLLDDIIKKLKNLLMEKFNYSKSGCFWDYDWYQKDSFTGLLKGPSGIAIALSAINGINSENLVLSNLLRSSFEFENSKYSNTPLTTMDLPIHTKDSESTHINSLKKNGHLNFRSLDKKNISDLFDIYFSKIMLVELKKMFANIPDSKVFDIRSLKEYVSKQEIDFNQLVTFDLLYWIFGIQSKNVQHLMFNKIIYSQQTKTPEFYYEFFNCDLGNKFSPNPRLDSLNFIIELNFNIFNTYFNRTLNFIKFINEGKVPKITFSFKSINSTIKEAKSIIEQFKNNLYYRQLYDLFKFELAIFNEIIKDDNFPILLFLKSKINYANATSFSQMSDEKILNSRFILNPNCPIIKSKWDWRSVDLKNDTPLNIFHNAFKEPNEYFTVVKPVFHKWKWMELGLKDLELILQYFDDNYTPNDIYFEVQQYSKIEPGRLKERIVDIILEYLHLEILLPIR